MEVQVHMAEKITTKWSQFQVHLNSAQQVAIKWLDADRQSANE